MPASNISEGVADIQMACTHRLRVDITADVPVTVDDLVPPYPKVSLAGTESASSVPSRCLHTWCDGDSIADESCRMSCKRWCDGFHAFLAAPVNSCLTLA